MTSPRPMDALMAPEDVAEILRVTPRYVRQLAQEGAIRYVLVGKRGYRFKRSDVEGYIQANMGAQPCSSDQKGRKTGTTTSKSAVVDFVALRAQRTGSSPRKSKRSGTAKR